MSTAFSITLQSEPSGDQDAALARLAFGADHHDAVFHQGLQPLGDESVLEIWRARGPVTEGRHGPITWRADSQLLFGIGTAQLDGDVPAITQDLYRHLFSCAHANGFEHLLRIWHFLPHIGSGTGDRERYRLFCKGRARAFDNHFDSTRQLPAGTAIGSRSGSTLLIYFIAAQTPGAQIENPRQISAFAYPRQYGPRQPMFSRAMVWPQESPTHLVVSGTASIVGHESQHPDDLQAQMQEIWHNLESLRERAGATNPLALRVYARRQADYPEIRAFLSARLTADVATVYLHAEICRPELLVEIEGVYAMPAASG